MNTDPKKLTEHLFNLRASAAEIRKALKEVQSAIEESEMALVEQFAALPEAQRSVRVPAGSITAVWKSKPEIEDQAIFHAHILDTRDLTLLQNRVSEAAVKKVWETGSQVPGVTRIDLMDLSYSSSKVKPQLETKE